MAEKGSVPSVSLVVSAAEKTEEDVEGVDDVADKSEGHLRCVIWRLGEKTRGGRVSSFCLRAMASEPFCAFSSRFIAVSKDGKGCVVVIVALLTLMMLRREPNAAIDDLGNEIHVWFDYVWAWSADGRVQSVTAGG